MIVIILFLREYYSVIIVFGLMVIYITAVTKITLWSINALQCKCYESIREIASIRGGGRNAIKGDFIS